MCGNWEHAVGRRGHTTELYRVKIIGTAVSVQQNSKLEERPDLRVSEL